jgi:hypothetical protein
LQKSKNKTDIKLWKKFLDLNLYDLGGLKWIIGWIKKSKKKKNIKKQQ